MNAAARSGAGAGASAPDPNDPAGIAMALGAAAALGLAIAVSRFAYDGGTNGLTVASTRACVLAAGLLAVCLATGRRLALARADWLNCAGLGLLMAMMFYGNVGAVEFIAVGLAALIFYTFPPMVAAIEAVLDARLPAPAKCAALALAFVGLFLMLGVSIGASDPRGVGLALAAGVCTAWNSVWIARRARHVDLRVCLFHMALIAAAALVTVTAASGAFVAPAAPAGWAGLAGVVALQCSAVPIYFAAIPRIGPLKSAMLANVQPVTSIAAAFVLFGELLTSVQLVGGAMVLAGIALMQRHDARRMRAGAS